MRSAAGLEQPLTVAIRPVFRPYLGGDLVRRFRRRPSRGDDNWTEEWIGSVTPAGNPDPVGRQQGLTVVAGQNGRERSLKDLVEADPEAMLGSSFVERHGASPGFLVKIISLGQVGPIHAHPSATFAERHLDTGHGQAEAWILLEPPGGGVNVIEAGVGFRPRTRRDDLLQAIRQRSGEAMRALLAGIEVRPGDAVLIRPGTPHYLGYGPLFIEVQQPSDFSVVPEYWSIGSSEEDGSLGLGWERALDAFDFSASTGSRGQPSGRQQARVLVSRGDTSEVALLDSSVDDLFEARVLRVAEEFDVPPGRFSIAVVTAGNGSIIGDWGRRPAQTGDVFAMPAALGHRFVAGTAPLQVHRCFGPAI
jgi:mannose-6-phosphate isomerase